MLCWGEECTGAFCVRKWFRQDCHMVLDVLVKSKASCKGILIQFKHVGAGSVYSKERLETLSSGFRYIRISKR